MFRLLFLFLLLAVGCDKKSPHPSSVLRMNIGEDPKTVDPRKARDLTSVTLMHMLFEGLTRTSQTGEAELALADSVEISDDGLKYVFHLRDSLWSNGDPVTSDDFAASWKTILYILPIPQRYHG